MPQEPHDQNFKNIFLDFPKEALEWLLPQAIEDWGPVQQVEFVRQEPKKQRLSDAHLALDMPILFTFRQHQLLLWLVEFQEDKSKFSIYKLAHYALDMMEAHPNATVVPTVLFTDRKKWRKDVARQLESVFHERMFLHFEYVFVKLFDFQAHDYYHIPNPVVKILLPKMQYPPEDRWEIIRQAYIGLFQLVSLALFEKYMDFIDIYAEVREEERVALQQEIQEHKETVMIAQWIKEEGRQEGRQEGSQQGNIMLLSRQFAKKFHLAPDTLSTGLQGLRPEDLIELGEYMLDCESYGDLVSWIQQRTQGNLS